MKILIEDLPEGEDDQIVIRCREMSEDLLRLIRSVRTRELAVFGYSGEDIHKVLPNNIYYFETVDNKVFLYCKEMVLETKRKLYEIEAELGDGDFLRVSKSVILNISKIQRLHPAFSGRLEADLDNGEKIIISRQYVADLKKKLGL